MDKRDDYFKLVDNPERVLDRDKELFREIEPIICELLDELKANGKINAFIPLEKNRLLSVMDNVYQMDINNNWLLEILLSKEKKRDFLASSSTFGFDESKLVIFYFHSCVLSCITRIELFKSYLLFHLKGVSYKASDFSRTMQSSAPNAWEKLKPYVNNDFRNSLAHGTYIVEKNNKVILFKDAEFIFCEQMDMLDFIWKVREQNVIYNVLVHVFRKKHDEGFFNIFTRKTSIR